MEAEASPRLDDVGIVHICIISSCVLKFWIFVCFGFSCVCVHLDACFFDCSINQNLNFACWSSRWIYAVKQQSILTMKIVQILRFNKCACFQCWNLLWAKPEAQTLCNERKMSVPLHMQTKPASATHAVGKLDYEAWLCWVACIKCRAPCELSLPGGTNQL